MSIRTSITARRIGLLVIAALILTLGYILGQMPMGGSGTDYATTYSGAGSPQSLMPESPEYSRSEPGVMGDESVGAAEDKSASSPGSDSMIIRNGWANLRVEDIDEGVTGVRSLATRYEAEISELFVQAGDDGPVRPLQEAPRGPATASITLRVPADRLDALMVDLASIGRILQESTSASDVTEQYVDLTARLANLRAEETRLREFFERAEDVDDLLGVQRELSRVRGEIEAMQAQVDHLERQSARATLTVSMTEPGPIVRPGGVDWGFREALTRGLQGAIALLTGAITALIAVSPVLLLGLLVWVVYLTARRRKVSRVSEPTADAVETSAIEE